MKVSHFTLVVLSGLVWMGIGVWLLSLGINILVNSTLHEQALTPAYKPIIEFFSSLVSSKESAVLILVAICLFVGYMKGRYVLGKSAAKGVSRILAFPNPTHLKNIYSKKYYILLGSMVFLGILVKYTTPDIRGAIDVIIGSALINGAMVYFRYAYGLRNVETIGSK